MDLLLVESDFYNIYDPILNGLIVRSALHDVLKTRGRAIILLLGDAPQRDLDPDLRHYMKTNTTIHWSDRLFWDKLR